jgi:hypothetical protein
MGMILTNSFVLLEVESLSDLTKDNIGPLPERKKSRRKVVETPDKPNGRKSPENIERLKKIGFQKGQSGNPGGRKATPKETKEWLEGKGLDMAQLLYDMALDESIHPKERMKAAMWVAEISVAKSSSEQKITVNHNHDIADMLSRINQARLKDDGKTIDITPNHLAIGDVSDA